MYVKASCGLHVWVQLFVQRAHFLSAQYSRCVVKLSKKFFTKPSMVMIDIYYIFKDYKKNGCTVS